MKNFIKYLIYLQVVIFTVYLGSCTPNSSITGPGDSMDESLLGLNIWSLVVDTFEVVDSNSYIEIISEVNYDLSPVEDSTRVTFFSNIGEIEQEKFTIDGQAITKLYPKDSENNLLSGELKVVASVGEKIFTYDTLDLYLKIKSGIELKSLEPSTGGDLVLNEGDSIMFVADASTASGVSPSFIWKVDDQIVSTVDNYKFKSNFRGYTSGEYDVELLISASEYNPVSYNWVVKVIDVAQGIAINSYEPSNSELISIDEGEAISFSVDAEDLDGNTLSYNWKLNNESVSTSDSYNFVTNYSSEGSYSMVLELSSSKTTQYLSWNIKVNNKNQDIVIIEILPNDGSNIYLNEGENLQFSIDATDPDGDPLAYEWSVDGANVSTAMSYNFITAYLPEDEGFSAGVYQLKLKATDISGGDNSITNFIWYVNVIDKDREIVIDQLLPGENGTSHQIFEGDSLQFFVDAYDPDGNLLTYNWKLDNTIISTNDGFYYKPDYSSAGNHIITLDLSDQSSKSAITSRKQVTKGGKESLSRYWIIEVLDKNAPIEVESITPTPGDLTINESESIDFEIEASDPEGNELTYTWKLNGGNIVSQTSTYQFISDYSSSGTYTISLIVSDGDGDEVFYLWNIEVIDADNPIVVTTIEPEPCNCIEMVEGDTQDFSIDAYDPDGNSLTYLWMFDGNFVSMGNEWSYVTDYDSAGEHELKLTVSDNTTKNTLNYTWTINVANVDRMIVVNEVLPSAGGDLNIFESDTIDFSIDAFDPDGNDLIYSWKVNNSEVSILDAYQFVTDYNSSGSYIVTLNVIDGFGKSEITYQWNVEVNDQSTNVSVLSITPSTGGNLTTDENSPINFKISAVDPTQEGLNYSYKLDNVEVSTDSTYQFITDYEGEGEYELKLKVWNAYTKDEVNYSWNIIVYDVDRPVVVNSILPSGSGSIAIDETENINFSVDAYDPDGNDLTYVWLLDNVSVSTTNSFQYTTNFYSSGSHSLSLTIDDGYGGKSIVEYNWDIIVNNVNRPIAVTSIKPTDGGPLTINQGESITFSIDAFDPDGNDLNYNWMVDNALVSSTDSYLFATNQTSGSSYTVDLIVADGDGYILNKSWDITVIPNSIVIVEVLPSPGGDQTIFETQSLNFSIEAYDNDGGILNYEWRVDGEVVSTEDNYLFTTDFTSSGTYNVTLMISASSSILSLTWNVDVLNNDQHIVVNTVYPSEGGNFSMAQYTSQIFSIDAYDPDGNDLLYVWKVDGSDSSYGSGLDFTASEAKTYIIELLVTDGTAKNQIQYLWSVEVVAQD